MFRMGAVHFRLVHFSPGPCNLPHAGQFIDLVKFRQAVLKLCWFWVGSTCPCSQAGNTKC